MNDNETEKKSYLSKEKFNELTEELKYLQSEKRKEIAEKLEYAKSLGDLSENSEYQEARESQAGLEDRIATIDGLLKSAVVVSSHKGDSVGIGSTVTLEKSGVPGRKTYQLVGSEEADMLQNKISNQSPIGEALIGKKKGDEFTTETPGGKVTYKVIKVD